MFACMSSGIILDKCAWQVFMSPTLHETGPLTIRCRQALGLCCRVMLSQSLLAKSPQPKVHTIGPIFCK